MSSRSCATPSVARSRSIPGDGFLPITVPAAFGAWVTALLRFGTADASPRRSGRSSTWRAGGFAVYAALQRRDRQRPPSSFRERVAVHGRRSTSTATAGARPSATLLTQPAWAATLQGRHRRRACASRSAGARPALRAALDYFYRGPVAEHVGRVRAHDRGARRQRSAPPRPASTRTTSPSYPHHGRGAGHASIYRGLDVYKCGPWTQGPVFLQQLTPARGLSTWPRSATTRPTTSTPSSRRPSWPSPTASAYYGDPAFVDVPLRAAAVEGVRRRAPRADRPGRRPRRELRPGDAPRHGRRWSSAIRRVYDRRHDPRRRRRRRGQHLRGDAQRRLDPVVAGRAGARLPARHARPAVLPRPGPPDRITRCTASTRAGR